MIAITGSTGQLGRRVVAHLQQRGVDARRIIAVARHPEKASDLDVAVREGDYYRPETLRRAFEGASRVLLISSSEVNQRVEQHRNVIDAAKAAGVRFIGYTSAPFADSSPMLLAESHRATEQMIRESGLNYAFLRNGWYMENYTDQIGRALEQGVVIGSARDGKISAATRDDLAEAAAVVMSSDGHDKAVYELGGDDAFTMNTFAAEVSRQSGTRVIYRDLPPEAYRSALVEVGLPEAFAAMLVDSDQAIANGHLFIDTGDLSRLIGRLTTSLRDALSDAVNTHVGSV